jgi:hypothetical protein
MYVYNPDYTWFCGSTPGRNATPPRWAPLNLHREREREQTAGRTAEPPAHPPGRDRLRPRAHPPPAAPAQQDRRRTGGHRQQHGRTDRQTERQTDTERREGPAAHGPVKHLDSIGTNSRHGHNAAPAGQSPPVIRRRQRQRPRRMKNGNGRKSRKAPGHLASPFLPSEKGSEDVQTPEGLLSA